MSYVTLDRVDPDSLPPYCVHGRTTCVVCGHWCWLGDKTYEVVHSGQCQPVCLLCARKGGTGLTGHIEDHRRADGPHT
jgi:hypothetical protein